MRHVLPVDDQKRFLYALRDHLIDGSRNLCFLTAENGKEAISILGTVPVDLIVTDLHTGTGMVQRSRFKKYSPSSIGISGGEDKNRLRSKMLVKQER